MQSHLHFPLSIPFLSAPGKGQAEQEMALLKKDLERRRDRYRGRHVRWLPMLNGDPVVVGNEQCRKPTICGSLLPSIYGGFGWFWGLPSGNLTKNYGKSPFSMGKSTISMAIFNSYVKLPEGIYEILLGLRISTTSSFWMIMNDIHWPNV